MLFNKLNFNFPLKAGGPGDTTYTISGTVYDADGSTAVSGATVALGAYNATSAANGTYTISDIPADTSGSMTCTKTGYSWTAITVAAMSGNLTSQNYTNAWWAAGGCGASCVRAYRAKGAANLAASYINLANPGTGNASPGIAPTFDASTGWTFNGAKWLTSGLSPNATGYSYLCQFSTLTSAGTYLFGCYVVSGNRVNILPDNGSNQVAYRNGGAGMSVAPSAASGNLGMAGTKAFRNGIAEGTAITNNAVNIACYIGAQNANGAENGLVSAKIQAWAAYSATLSDTQMAAVATAMANL